MMQTYNWTCHACGSVNLAESLKCSACGCPAEASANEIERFKIKLNGESMNSSMVTTALSIPGYRIDRSIGLVRGITVRSRSIVGNFFGGLQTLFGGNITIYAELCEQARAEAYGLMCQHAKQLGANAIICVRYDTTEIMQGLTEVICYGTAVFASAERPA
jgi:uncharacterized protein YbjQ (UPF0145 family)